MSPTSLQQVIVMEQWSCQLVMDLLRGNWCNGFWLIVSFRCSIYCTAENLCYKYFQLQYSGTLHASLRLRQFSQLPLCCSRPTF